MSKLVAIERHVFLYVDALDIYLPSLGVYLKKDEIINYLLKVKENIMVKRETSDKKGKITKK